MDNEKPIREIELEREEMRCRLQTWDKDKIKKTTSAKNKEKKHNLKKKRLK